MWARLSSAMSAAFIVRVFLSLWSAVRTVVCLPLSNIPIPSKNSSSASSLLSQFHNNGDTVAHKVHGPLTHTGTRAPKDSYSTARVLYCICGRCQCLKLLRQISRAEESYSLTGDLPEARTVLSTSVELRYSMSPDLHVADHLTGEICRTKVSFLAPNVQLPFLDIVSYSFMMGS